MTKKKGAHRLSAKTIGASLIALYREEYGYEHTADRASLIEKLTAVNARVNWGALLDAAETVGIPYWERPDYVPSRVTGAEVAQAWASAMQATENVFDKYWLSDRMK